MITNEHPWPLFIAKALYKNSLELEASRIPRTFLIYILKYLSLESSRNLLWNILLIESSREYSLYIIFTISSKKTLEPLTTWVEPK